MRTFKSIQEAMDYAAAHPEIQDRILYVRPPLLERAANWTRTAWARGFLAGLYAAVLFVMLVRLFV